MNIDCKVVNIKLYEESACSFGIPSVIENQKGVVVALDRAQVLWFSGS